MKVMNPLRIPLRIVFYEDDGRWIAHCLEFDLIGDGGSPKEALTSLGKAIHVQVAMSVEKGSPRSLFTPADPEYFEKFARGQDSPVAVGELTMSMRTVKIERAEIRQYIPDPADAPNTYAHA